MPPGFDAGCETLLLGGAAGELLHWTESTREAMILASQRDDQLRFLLVGFELWARLTLRGDSPENLSEELLAVASAPRKTAHA